MPGRVFVLYSLQLPPRTATKENESLVAVVDLLVHLERKYSRLEAASDNARTDKTVIAICRGFLLFVVAPSMAVAVGAGLGMKVSTN